MSTLGCYIRWVSMIYSVRKAEDELSENSKRNQDELSEDNLPIGRRGGGECIIDS